MVRIGTLNETGMNSAVLRHAILARPFALRVRQRYGRIWLFAHEILASCRSGRYQPSQGRRLQRWPDMPVISGIGPLHEVPSTGNLTRMTAASFECRNCRRLFEGTALDLCFACLATQTRISLAGLGGGSSAVVADRPTHDFPPVRASSSAAAPTKKAKPLKRSHPAQQQPREEAGRIGSGQANRRQRLRPIGCVLCGALVPAGHLLKHKAEAHGERQVVASKPRHRKRRAWVLIVSGGLPSLGKRR